MIRATLVSWENKALRYGLAACTCTCTCGMRVHITCMCLHGTELSEIIIAQPYGTNAQDSVILFVMWLVRCSAAPENCC